MGGEEDTEKKKKTKKKNNNSTNYEVDQSYSFKDLVVSQPSWTLFGGGGDGGEGEEDKAGGEDVEAKTLNKIERPSSSSSLSSSSDEEEQRGAKATRATKPSSSSFEIKPKPAKRSLRETLLPFDESEMKRKSRAWQLPAFSSSKAAAAGGKRRKSATEKKDDDHGDKDIEEEAKETHRRTLAEWHQTVDKFRDDYKAKRKAAVRRSKRG
jgi:hypothetical protein